MTKTDWNGATGYWDTVGDWSHGVPDEASTAVFTTPGNYKVTILTTDTITVRDIDFDAAGATLFEGGVLNLGGTFDLRAGTLQLVEGVINGGTLKLDGGTFAPEEGGLDNVHVIGTLGLSDTTLLISEGLSVTTQSGAPGAVKLGQGADLFLYGTQTLDNFTMHAGGTGGAGSLADAIEIDNVRGAGATLTLGANFDLISTGATDRFDVTAVHKQPVEVINDGRLDADASGGILQVSVATFQNEGRVVAENGDTFMCAGALSGTGQVRIVTGGVAELASVAADQDVVFGDATGFLKLTDAAGFAATLSGAVVGDTIDLVKTVATAAGVNSSDQLVITDGGATVATLQLKGDYANIVFNVSSDRAHGSLITLANATSVHGFAQAMAGLGGVDALTSSPIGHASHEPAPLLIAPRALVA